MGYTTIFSGSLAFTCEMTAPMLAKLNTYFGANSDEFPDLAIPRGDGGYIDLMLTKDFSGICWDDGTEKTYNLEKIVDAIIATMRKTYPQFGLTGSLTAQGEDIDDRWLLVINDEGRAEKRGVPVPGVRVICPHCDEPFMYETSQS